VRANKCPQIARLQIGPRHYAGKKKEYKEFEEYEEFKERANNRQPGVSPI
jgi:hypothetical protein